ncbi:MAG: hypothetical protein GY903_20370 [Fuerstiella sp.]|nr:hypothetical protein [Fuerstiella sp.]MCP4856844.1 hypothetical protein [Fuerstiella sp.]
MNIETNRIRIMASLVILALLATASFSSAQAQQPSEEQLARILKRFPEADTDKDGKLSTEEIQQFAKSRQRKTRRAAAAEPTQAGSRVIGTSGLSGSKVQVHAVAEVVKTFGDFRCGRNS